LGPGEVSPLLRVAPGKDRRRCSFLHFLYFLYFLYFLHFLYFLYFLYFL
jgi:hypothetical protein